MTLYSRPSLLQLWQCPECGRVENWHGSRRPVCAGIPEAPHAKRPARKVRSNENLRPGDDRRLFR